MHSYGILKWKNEPPTPLPWCYIGVQFDFHVASDEGHDQ